MLPFGKVGFVEVVVGSVLLDGGQLIEVGKLPAVAVFSNRNRKRLKLTRGDELGAVCYPVKVLRTRMDLVISLGVLITKASQKKV